MLSKTEKHFFFFEILCIRLWLSQSPKAIDEVVSLFGCQLVQVTLDINEP